MGRPKANLLGKIVGHWTVVSFVGSKVIWGKQQPVWLCRCVCGVERELPSDLLRDGGSRSCGCKTAELSQVSHLKDYTGYRFGKLIALEFSYRENNKTYWKCKCDCGNEVVLCMNRAVVGNVKSCGCLPRGFQIGHPVFRKSYFKDETGNVYGRLTVLEKVYQGNKKEWYWRCRCECGNEIITRGSHFRSGCTRSCGCLATEERQRPKKHGLTHTKTYKRIQSRKRKKKEKYLDINWNAEKEIALRTLFGSCVLCGMTEAEHQQVYGTSLHVDHVRPLKLGHGLDVGNAIILCAGCNRKKSATPIKEIKEPMRSRILQAADLFKVMWNSRQ